VGWIGQKLLAAVPWKVVPLFEVRIPDVDVCAGVVGSEEAALVGLIVIHCVGCCS